MSHSKKRPRNTFSSPSTFNSTKTARTVTSRKPSKSNNKNRVKSNQQETINSKSMHKRDHQKNSNSNKSHPKNRGLHESQVKNDEEGHLVFKLGDVLKNRYKIIAALGKGTFAQVVHVEDMETNCSVALKIVRNVDRYRESAEIETSILRKLGTIDPTSVHLCVKMLSSFNYRGHVCIAFNKFGLSLYDFLKRNHYYPYNLVEIRHIAYQLCFSVKFLHDNKLTHTDLKLENIIFVNSDYDLIYDSRKKKDVKRVKRTDIRLIDFGNAVFDDQHHSRIVSTRNYRAPEVILELGWAQPCDVWSIGCILFEMYYGDFLFRTHDNMEHLAMMERILGEIPYTMTKASKKRYFYRDKLDWNDLSTKGRYVKDNCKPLMRYKRKEDDNHNSLFDLIRRMLKYEPSRRITLKQATSHNFFSKIPSHQRLRN